MIDEARKLLGEEELSPERAIALHGQLRVLLKDTDPFWPRWLYLLEAKGVAP